MRACKEAGFRCQVASFPLSCPEAMNQIHAWNQDPHVHGIIVQLPAPDADDYINAIHPDKDVDGLGKNSSFIPCTAKGVMVMIDAVPCGESGKHAVVIGRSRLVGKPLAKLLLDADFTVTVCHSKTQDLASITRTADVLISAAGVPNLVTADMVKPGATVIDVGINKHEGKTVGDVCFDEVKEVAGYITPVPGGVGPMTVAMLLDNTAEAFRRCDKF